MIVLATVLSFFGIFFMREAAKHYNRYDPYMNFIPMFLSTVMTHGAGFAWTIYYAQGW